MPTTIVEGHTRTRKRKIHRVRSYLRQIRGRIRGRIGKGGRITYPATEKLKRMPQRRPGKKLY